MKKGIREWAVLRRLSRASILKAFLCETSFYEHVCASETVVLGAYNAEGEKKRAYFTQA